MFLSGTRAARVAATTAIAALVGCARPPRLTADLVITRANVWTGNSLQPAADAVAVIGDRIVDVGGAADIERWSGANTTVLDAAGRRLVPGFNDAGVGFADGGAVLDHVDLRDAATAAEFARRINERAERAGLVLDRAFSVDMGGFPAALSLHRKLDRRRT